MHDINAAVTSTCHDPARQQRAIARRMLARRPLRIHHEVLAPRWSVRRRLDAALAAPSHWDTDVAPRPNQTGQPAR
jgi:hypothetical protein